MKRPFYFCRAGEARARKAVAIAVQSSVQRGCRDSHPLFALHLESFCLTFTHNSGNQDLQLHSADLKLLAHTRDVVVSCTDKQSTSDLQGS